MCGSESPLLLCSSAPLPPPPCPKAKGEQHTLHAIEQRPCGQVVAEVGFALPEEAAQDTAEVVPAGEPRPSFDHPRPVGGDVATAEEQKVGIPPKVEQEGRGREEGNGRHQPHGFPKTAQGIPIQCKPERHE